MCVFLAVSEQKIMKNKKKLSELRLLLIELLLVSIIDVSVTEFTQQEPAKTLMEL